MMQISKIRLGFKTIISLVLISCFQFAVNAQLSNAATNPKSTPSKETYLTNIEKLPVFFRKNMGQWEDNIIYRGSSPGWSANVNFMKNGLSMGFIREEASDENSPEHSKTELRKKDYLIWNLLFKNANPEAIISANGEEDSHANYLYGSDASKHHINVPDYRIVNYQNIYPGIDVNYYSTGKNLKYDYLVHKGANANQLQLTCEGIKNLSINTKGQLEITTPWGILIEEIPESYQIINGKKSEVKVKYKLIDATTFSFNIGEEYDQTQDLIIDPVTLEWSTYVGGGPGGDGYLYDIAIDDQGNIYGGGWYSDFFPTTAGVFDNTFNGNMGRPYGDAYAFKLDATGSTLIYSSYLGGSGNDMVKGIIVNTAGEAFVVGITGSPNFPVTTGAIQTNNGGGAFDVFVARINSTGTALIYSTYLGGSGWDSGIDIAVNNLNEAFITGNAQSGFPTVAGSYDTSPNGGADAFISKLNSTGTSLIYSTYVGGGAGDYGYGIAINGSGEAFITGSTNGTFPTTAGAFDASFNGNSDVFITRMNAAGNTLIYSTFIGCNDYDYAQAIAINSADEAYITGNTATWIGPTNSFPVTPGAYDVTFNGGRYDAYALRINSTGTALVYSTYLGGLNDDWAHGIAVNSIGEAFVAGFSQNYSGTINANPYPTTSCAYNVTFNSAMYVPDVFISKLNTSGNTLLYSTYMGGSSADYYEPKVIVRGTCPEEVIASCTSHSPDFPTTPGAYQVTKLNGGNSSDQPVLFKFIPQITPGYTVSSNLSCNTPVQFTDTTNQCGLWTPLNSWFWDFGDGTTSTLTNPTHIYATGGTYNVKLVVGCPMDSITMAVNVSSVGCCTTSITALKTDVSCYNGNDGTATVAISAGSSSSTYTYSWSNGTTTTQTTISNLTANTYSVTVSDGSGCSVDTVIIITEPNQLNIVVISQPANCVGTSTGTLNAVIGGGMASYTYLWSTGNTTALVTNLSAALYSVTVSDASGCTINGMVNITEPPALVLNTVTNASSCGQSNGSATVNPNGGTGSYSYTWNTGLTTQNITNVTAGIYNVTVTDVNGCTESAVINIGNNPGVTAQSQAITNARCFGNCDGSISVIGNGGTTPYTYDWNNLQNTATANGLCAGLYTCTITDNNGCNDIISFTISQPSMITSITTATNALCFGGNTGSASVTIAGGTAGYNYQWNTNPNQYTSNATGIPAGIYQATITDNNNCIRTTSVTVTEPSQLIVNINSYFSICAGQTATLTSGANGGISPYNFLWSSGQQTSSITQQPSSYSIYTVTVTDANNCSSLVSTTVNVNGLPIVSYSASDTTGCPVFCTTFTNFTPNTNFMTWSFGDGNSDTTSPSQHCYSTPGIYSVNLVITDNNGCSNSLSKNNYITVSPKPVAAFSANPKKITQLSGPVIFTDASQNANAWNWSFGDELNSQSALQNAQFTYGDTGIFQVILIVFNEYGCSDTTDEFIKVNPEFALYVPNTFTPNEDGLNEIFIPVGIGVSPEEFEFYVYDRWGDLIWNTSRWGDGWDGRANGGTNVAQQDVYVWKIKIKDSNGNKHRYVGSVNLIK